MSKPSTSYDVAFPALGSEPTTKAPSTPLPIKPIFPVNKGKLSSNRNQNKPADTHNDWRSRSHESRYDATYRSHDNHDRWRPKAKTIHEDSESDPSSADEKIVTPRTKSWNQIVSGDVDEHDNEDTQVVGAESDGYFVPNDEVKKPNTDSSDTIVVEPKPTIKFNISPQSSSYSPPAAPEVNIIERTLAQARVLNKIIENNNVNAEAEAEAQLEAQDMSPLRQRGSDVASTYSRAVGPTNTPAQNGPRASIRGGRFVDPFATELEFCWSDTIDGRTQVYTINQSAYYVR